MASYNTVIKKRNDTNTGWDSILPITLAQNVLTDGGGDVASQLAQIESDMTQKPNYEQGTFTPYFGASTSDGEMTYSVQSGTYMKIGNQVTIFIKLKISTITTQPVGTRVYIRGVPFTLLDDGAVSNVAYSGITLGTGKRLIILRIANTVLELKSMEDGVGINSLSPNILASNSEIIMSITYRTV